jgi:RimJ/RimL family protein N-acetyltransferase
MTELQFDNMILRPFRDEDSLEFYHLIQRNRARLEKYFPVTVRSNETLESTRKYIYERIYLAEKREFISFILLPKGSSSVLGLVFLKNIDWSIPKSEIGFFIDKDQEGKGMISKSVSEIVKYSFSELKLNKIFMRIGEDNPGSKRIAEKSGFKFEGNLRNDFKSHDGKLLDVLYYGLTPQDFNRRSLRKPLL